VVEIAFKYSREFQNLQALFYCVRPGKYFVEPTVLILGFSLGYLPGKYRNFHNLYMTSATLFFWICVGIVVYCYAGYGLLLMVWNRIKNAFKRSARPSNSEFPAITLIVAAYNEIDFLEKKIHNSIELDYPLEKLHFIFITDGSSDNSPDIVRSYPRIMLLHQQHREGKLAAIKRAMLHVETPLVVFTDANSILNPESIKRIVQHFNDPEVGGVAGEKKILEQGMNTAVGEAEGLYWKYESFLKKQDAGFYTVVGAAGELFSIRTSLFQQLPDELILDDFLISMQVCLKGYRIAYEPHAFASESPSASLLEEEKRKIRIAAGAYQSLGYLKECMNVFRHPLLAFQFVSRRVLRWIICPLLLPLIFILTIFLAAISKTPGIYTFLFFSQLLFYFLAIIGWMLVRAGKKAGLLSVPFYFVFMNYCLFKGLALFLKGSQTVLWEKSLRQKPNIEVN
jgi:biofilm PGA synthesis N-glycosyltransferase PgaC